MNEENLSFTFENIAGKSISEEQKGVTANGFKEAYRLPIKGGFASTFARKKIVMINGERKDLYFLDKMPPEELLEDKMSKSFGLKECTAMVGKEKELVSGTYGMVGGAKFFVIGKTTKKSASKSEPKRTRTK